MIKLLILLALTVCFWYVTDLFFGTRKSGIAVAIGAAMLFLDAKDAVPMLMTVSFIFMLECICKDDRLFRIIKYLGYLLLVFLIGAFPVCNAFINHSLFDEKYAGFFFRYSYIHLTALIYMLVIILVFLRTSVKDVAVRLVIAALVLSLDMAGFIGLIPSLTLYSDGTMDAYDFMLVFYVIKLTVDAVLICFKDNKKKVAIIAACFAAAILSVFVIGRMPKGKGLAKPETDAYEEFFLSHTDENVFGIINTLEKRVELTDKEKEEYGVLLSDEFEILNAKCRKLGIEEPLFIPVTDVSIEFEDGERYHVTPYENGIYNISYNNVKTDISDDPFYMPFKLISNEKPETDIYIYDTFSGRTLKYTPDQSVSGETSYLWFRPVIHYDINLRIPAYRINENVSGMIGDVLFNYMVDEVKNASFAGDIIGVILSIVGVFLFIAGYFLKGREELISSMDEKLRSFCDNIKVVRFFSFISENRIYFLAFLIPFAVKLTLLIIFDCMPFGINSLFDSDGIEIGLPSYWENANVIRTGNKYLSLGGAWGYSIYSGNLISRITERFFNLLGNGGIVSYLDLKECFSVGFCGLSFAVYLTNRLFLEKADKKDAGILIPAAAYALNAYVVAVHTYAVWIDSMFIFPLIILCFERLMLKKKYLCYALLLCFSTVINIQLSIYICAFLVLYFFTYKFEDVKDFFTKGVRFALVSVISQIPAIPVILGVIGGTSDTSYRDKDSVFPAFGFHKNFFDQWKQYLYMPVIKTINPDEGGLNVYMGILTLLLAGVFIISKKRSIKDKIRLVFPVAFLTLAFNGKVLSYILNGFHYQTLVPNRYAFLMVFMLCMLAWEGLNDLEESGNKTILIVICGFIMFYIFVFLLGKDRPLSSGLISLGIVGVYLLLMILLLKLKGKNEIMRSVIVLCFLFEIISGYYLNAKSISFGEITTFGDIEKERYAFSHLKKEDADFERFLFPSSSFICGGAVYDVPSIAWFNPYVSKHQTDMATVYGYASGGNWLKDDNASARLMNSMQSVKYISIPKISKGMQRDIDIYEYVGETDQFFIYRNEDALPIGLYMPVDIAEILDVPYNTPIYLNNMAAKCLKSEDEVFDIDTLIFGEEENGFDILGKDGNTLSLDEANELYADLKMNDRSSVEDNVKIRVRVCPKKSGWTYITFPEVKALGYLKNGKNYEIVLPYPITSAGIVNMYNVFTINEDVYENYIGFEKENSLYDVSISNDVISGRSNYPEEGYTMFSVAYNEDYRAYIDGEETEVLDVLGNAIFVRTPAGEHEIRLEFKPKKLNLVQK